MKLNLRIKTFDERKKERDVDKKKRENSIQNVLNSFQNNPKFARLLNFSLNTIDNLISPLNREFRLNIITIIHKNGTEILKDVALKNKENEDVVNHITDIIWKLTSLYDNIDKNLAKHFVEENGHKSIMELLIKKNKGYGSISLFKIFNGLVKVPHLMNRILDSGLIDTFKQINDIYNDDLAIIDLNFDTLLKISNSNYGREYIIKKEMCPYILTNIKICSDLNDANGIATGLEILNNICRNDEGKNVLKKADGPLILCQVVDKFNGSEIIVNKAAKIFSKLFTKEDFDTEFQNFQNSKKKFETENNLNNITECKNSLNLIANMVLVEDLAKLLSKVENFDELVFLFNKFYDIDLNEKPPDYIKEYINIMKHFMNEFKRVFDQAPDYLDEKTKKGTDYKELIKKITECIKKNWESTKLNVEKLEKEKNNEADQIKVAFKGFFTAYIEILYQINNFKSEEEKKNEYNKILDYVIEEVIANSSQYLRDDELPNYAASKILKIYNDANKKNPENFSNNLANLKKCIPYIKGVIEFSNNWKTLSNDLDIIQNVYKSKNENDEIDIIPTIVNFMNEKPKFRLPNLTNLNILNDFLTPEIISNYQQKTKNSINNILDIDYVDAINSVMANPNKTETNYVQDPDESFDEDIIEDNGELEPKNDEIEKNIIIKGSELLKKLITLENFLTAIKDFKNLSNKFKPENANEESTKNLNKSLVYQNCALNVNEFFEKGMIEDFLSVKNLIKKEINYIEGFKRTKSNENNPQYQDICNSSNKRLKLCLGTLRILENQSIEIYNQNKDENCKNLIKDISDLNNEVIDKSSDSLNLIEHLLQLRKNITFIREKEEEIITKKHAKLISENCINSLMNIFRKMIENDDLNELIIKNLIGFADQKKNVCDNLVRLGCPRLLMQILENTYNKQLANVAVELLDILISSSDENSVIIGNQNILIKLFVIRSKFANSEEITKKLDHIANEIMKSPQQANYSQELIKEAILEFHENVRNIFEEEETKQKILNNLEIINLITSNKKQIEPILKAQFIDDLGKAVNLTVKSQELSQIIDKLLTNEMVLVKKIKENIYMREDPKHYNLVDDIMKIILEKPNFIDPLIVSCKCLSSYIIDNELYEKHVSKIINDNFIDKLFLILEDNLDNQEVIKEINNILCHLAIKNQDHANCIVKKGGLANIINEIKSTSNLNDSESLSLKINGLKMLNFLLNDNENIDKFIKANGIDLINKLVKSEVNNAPEVSKKELLEEGKFFTNCNICTKTIEQLNTYIKLGKFPFPELAENSKDVENKSKQIMDDLMGDDKNYNVIDDSENSENYCVQCLKIINKGLNKDKKEFVDDNILSNLTNLAQVNFPNKFLFNEIASLLSNKNVDIPNDQKTNEILLKLCLSNKALFYSDNLVKERVQNLENKISQMLINDKNYKTTFINLLEDKDKNLTYEQKTKLLTFASLLTEKQEPLKEISEEAKPQLCSFFIDMLNNYKPIIEKILTCQKSRKTFYVSSLKNNEKYDEGILLSLVKVYNYLIQNEIIEPKDPKNIEYIHNLNILSSPFYKADNYIFVNEYEKEMGNIDNKIGKYENGKEPDEYSEIIIPTKTYLKHLEDCFTKTSFFLDDFHKEMESLPHGEYSKINKQKEDNFDKILTFSEEYFKSEDADPKIKNDQCKKLKDPLYNLFYDFAKQGALNNKLFDENLKNDIEKKMNKLWGLMSEVIKNDKDNIIINIKEPSKIIELVNRINDMFIENNNMKKQGKIRYIPLNISRKCFTDEYLNIALIDFVKEDFQNMKKNEEDILEIKYIDLEILANVSKHPASMIEIMKIDNLLDIIKTELENPNLTIKQRGIISEIIHNATKSNYEIQNILKKDPKLMSLILKKILNNPVKTLEKDEKKIAQKDIDTLCNILKDDNNIIVLNKIKLLNENDLKNLIEIYDKLDPKLTEPLKPLLLNLEEINNNKKEIATVEDDEFDLKEISRKVSSCYKNHKDSLLKMGKSRQIVQCTFIQDEIYKSKRRKIENDNEEDEIEDIDNEPQMPVIARASSIHKKRLSYITGTLLFNPLNKKVKSKLDTNENQEMSTDLDKILATLIKNYNDLKLYKGENSELDKKKVENCLTCLSLLKTISLATDNHKPILERGFMNWIENFNEDFKLINKDDTVNINKIECPILLEAKNVLQACSNSENAKPFIRDSNVLMDIIEELNILYDKPNLVKSNEIIGKCFLYDNVIFSNLCKDKKGFDVILGQLGLDKLIYFGQKTGNSNLLEGILLMLINYVKKMKNKDDIPQEIIDSIFEILDKCINLKAEKTPQIMSKFLILAGLLYDSKHAPKIDNIDLIKNMNNDIELYKEDKPYVNTCLYTLYILGNKPNFQKSIDNGLFKKLNDIVLKMKEEPENEQTEPNINLKTVYNLTKVYNKLADADPLNIQKFNNMGISNNVINFMINFNEKAEPIEEDKRSLMGKSLYSDKEENKEDESESEEDINIENDKNLNEEKKEEKKIEEGDFIDDDQDIDKKSKNDLIIGIMGNSINTMKKVTADSNNNEFIANETPFGDIMLKTLDNKNYDKTIISSGLHALENYLKIEKGKNFENLDLNALYNLLKKIQINHFSVSNLMKTINNISSSLVNILKDDKKDFILKFFSLLNDSTKMQELNPELILSTLKQMYDCLIKKPFLVNEVGEEIIPNIINILKLYKDNLEIQGQCYSILELFSKDPKLSLLIINNELIGLIKETLKIPKLNEENIINEGHPIKECIFKLLSNLSNEKSNCKIISDEFTETLIKEIETKGYNIETKNIINMFDKLLKNEECVQNFVTYNGIDNSINLLKKNEENDELIIQLFSILKNVATVNDENKQNMLGKKVPELVNTIIDKIGQKNKNIEFHGRNLIFTINNFKLKLEDPNSIAVGEIKLEDPIPPEVRNFLTNGRQVNIINNNGDMKQVQLIFNYDLKKVMAKKMKSTLPPKPKYIIDVPNIKKLLKGHGSDAFKSYSGLFRKIPSPELCFTIIGPTTVEGTKMLNIVCETEKDVDRWIKYIEIVINFFRRNKTIKTAVVIRKKI